MRCSLTTIAMVKLPLFTHILLIVREQETLKDARTANADMDDDALTSSRQVARLRHALEDSQGTLKEAQAALSQVGIVQPGKWMEETPMLCLITSSGLGMRVSGRAPPPWLHLHACAAFP